MSCRRARPRRWTRQVAAHRVDARPRGQRAQSAGGPGRTGVDRSFGCRAARSGRSRSRHTLRAIGPDKNHAVGQELPDPAGFVAGCAELHAASPRVLEKRAPPILPAVVTRPCTSSMASRPCVQTESRRPRTARRTPCARTSGAGDDRRVPDPSRSVARDPEQDEFLLVVTLERVGGERRRSRGRPSIPSATEDGPPRLDGRGLSGAHPSVSGRR